MKQALLWWMSLVFCTLKKYHVPRNYVLGKNVYSLESRETPIIKNAGISLSYSRGFIREVSNGSEKIAVKIHPNVAPKRIFTQCCIAQFAARLSPRPAIVFTTKFAD